MAGMTQKELKKSYFHCGPIRDQRMTKLLNIDLFYDEEALIFDRSNV